MLGALAVPLPRLQLKPHFGAHRAKPQKFPWGVRQRGLSASDFPRPIEVAGGGRAAASRSSNVQAYAQTV